LFEDRDRDPGVGQRPFNGCDKAGGADAGIGNEEHGVGAERRDIPGNLAGDSAAD
jgi:hypothetical protein